MKLKNVKRGVRVELKSPCRTKDTLPVGAKGTILESNEDMPFIEWDNFTDGHDCCDPTVPKSCWAVGIQYLRRVKE